MYVKRNNLKKKRKIYRHVPRPLEDLHSSVWQPLNYLWLLKLKYNKIVNLSVALCTFPVPSRSRVAVDCCSGPPRHRAFPSLQKSFLDISGLIRGQQTMTYKSSLCCHPALVNSFLLGQSRPLIYICLEAAITKLNSNRDLQSHEYLSFVPLEKKFVNPWSRPDKEWDTLENRRFCISRN